MSTTSLYGDRIDLTGKAVRIKSDDLTWNGQSVHIGGVVLYGVGSPTVNDGTTGDFYLATGSNTLFGPKEGGVWPVGIPLGSTSTVSISEVQGPAVVPVPDGGTITTFRSPDNILQTPYKAYLVKIGNMVMCRLPAWGIYGLTGTMAVISFPGLIPVGYRPFAGTTQAVVQTSTLRWNAGIPSGNFTVNIGVNGNVDFVGPNALVSQCGSFFPVAVQWCTI